MHFIPCLNKRKKKNIIFFFPIGVTTACAPAALFFMSWTTSVTYCDVLCLQLKLARYHNSCVEFLLFSSALVWCFCSTIHASGKWWFQQWTSVLASVTDDVTTQVMNGWWYCQCTFFFLIVCDWESVHTLSQIVSGDLLIHRETTFCEGGCSLSVYC